MNTQKLINFVVSLLTLHATLPVFGQNSAFLLSSSVVTIHYSECLFGDLGSCDFGSVTTNLYDDHGNLIQSVNFSLNPNGTVVGWVIATSTYDAQSKPLVRVEESDSDADGTLDWRSTTLFSYPSAYQTRQFASIDSGVDGTVDQTTTTTTTFDHRATPILEFVESDFDGDGMIDQTTTTTTTRDQHGDPILEVVQTDSNADGTVDTQVESKWIYDDRNNRIYYYQDQYHETPTATYTTDNQRNPLSVAGLADLDGAELPFTGTYTYDNYGNLIETKLTLVIPNGRSAPVTLTKTVTDSYVHRGELLRDLH